MTITILGLSITSSWGNGHATTYRALAKALAARGHRVRFLERDVPWYAENRDMPRPSFAEVTLYRSLDELRARHAAAVREADLVIVGSYVPDGIAVGDWARTEARGLVAFYDIDTPVTLAALQQGGTDYLSLRQIPAYDLYLSFTGGPTLRRIERELGSPMARPLYCAVDPELYRPDVQAPEWELGYMGTYSADRQPALERLLLQPARRLGDRRFVVAGPMYPDDVTWPANVARVAHVSPAEHRRFYCRQRFTLNVTRADMVRAGHSPSVRLFEAAACGVPIISDDWPGLAELFRPHHEILIARNAEDVVHYLSALDAADAALIGARARRRVLAEHTADHRARELESYVAELRQEGRGSSGFTR
ncbi:MAG TPA: glycosyltransferase [Polyangia bacterium]|nr:glycosyltransferase [Polyangia bacterium]